MGEPALFQRAGIASQKALVMPISDQGLNELVEHCFLTCERRTTRWTNGSVG